MISRVKRQLTNVTFIALSSFLLIACEYNYVDTSGILPDEVSYKEHIQPVFQTTCISCHHNNATPPILRQEKSYEALINGSYINADNPEHSKLIKKINTGHPFVDVPSDFEKQLILQWMTEGALNN